MKLAASSVKASSAIRACVLCWVAVSCIQEYDLGMQVVVHVMQVVVHVDRSVSGLTEAGMSSVNGILCACSVVTATVVKIKVFICFM